MTMRPRVVALFAIALVAGCTAPSRQAGPTTTTEPASTSRVALDCTDPIGSSTTLPPVGERGEVFGDAVALQTSASTSFALQTSLTGDEEQTARLFAKTPLLVKAGAQAEIIVPPNVAGSLEFEWGNTVNRTRTTDLSVGPCPAATPDTWLVYPGGYYVPRPQCVQVIVRAGGTDTMISVGVGVACPGQQPPPQPTDT